MPGNSSNGLKEFFDELREAETHNPNIDEELINQFKDFVDDKLYKVIMDDSLFEIEEQPKLLKKIEEDKKLFLEFIHKPWLKHKKIIAVAGRFSAGKSSFLNAVIGDLNLPVSNEASTAIPTYITFFDDLHQENWDNSDYMLVNSSTDGHKKMPIERLEYFKKDTLKDFPIPISQIIRHFVISKWDNILMNKVIIDTPGIDPADKKGFDFDDQITKNSIELADIIFWLMDVNDGDLGAQSLEYIKKNIKPHQELIVIVNKTDTKPPSEIKEVKEKVIDTLNKNKIKYRSVITFSKKEKKHHDTIKNALLKVEAEKTIPQIIKDIEEMLKESKSKITELIKDNQEKIEVYELYLKDVENLNVFADDFPIKAKKLLEIAGNTEESINTLLEYRNKIILDYNYLMNIHSLDSGFLNGPYYKMEEAKMQEYKDKVPEIIFTSMNIGDYMGFEKGYWFGISNKARQKIEELDELETLINESIEEFEIIKYKLNQI